MYQVIIVIHMLLGLGVISLVLIQHGKGADAGAAFGSASSGSVFGAQGASSFLSRTTAILAALFFTTSLGLAVLSGRTGSEVDLMDTPEVKEVFADVPLVNGGVEDATGGLESVPTIEQGAPIIEQSTPSIEETVLEQVENIDAPAIIHTVSEKIEAVDPKVLETLEKEIVE
jgi:preprotein translocase subunit SecG